MQEPLTFRVEVRPRQQEGAAASNRWIELIRQHGLESLESCASARLFYLRGPLTRDEAEQISRCLLIDPVTEEFSLSAGEETPLAENQHSVEVSLLPGVTDPVAENLVWAAHQLGYTSLERAATGQRYILCGALTAADLHRLAVDIFSNPVIQRHEIDHPIAPPFAPTAAADSTVEIIALRNVDDTRLMAISAGRRLALDLAEMQAIRAYFHREGRDPTDVELEMLAQTWSEHCVHKTFKATIDYTGPQPGPSAGDGTVRQRIDGLLRTYIRAATEQLGKPWVRSAFVDNAGIIAFDDHWDVAFKVETHNHPSALEPFGGANTGVGGVVRDVLGVSARPIANTDVLCFGPQDLPDCDLPPGVLHPRRIEDGVLHGIEDYGNKMGIPTVNGAIFYHPGYTSNPLVFCGCLGLMPHGSHRSGAQPGDLVVVLGGRTGRDGLRGATFSSMEMDETTGEVAGAAVQIGHPINEKQVLEVVLQARDEGLYRAITDCGAGGLSSAVGEMAADTGASIHLERVLLKYPGLRPWEIWLSEAQERMVLAIPPEYWARFELICAGHEIEAVCIGEFTSTGRLHLAYGDQTVGELSTDFLHNGIPTRHLEAVWEPTPPPADVQYPVKTDFTADLLALLAHPNIRSKEAVIRRYDHEVQGGTAIKPLIGAAEHGPGDATVLVPLGTPNGSDGNRYKGVALSVGMCPQYGEIDPYAMAWAAIDEAVRNAVAVGADPDQIAILDNFCWGNPNLPDRLGALVRSAQGCYDAALAYGTPFISGKDSLNNEYTAADGTRHAIPGTLLISAVGIVPDVRRAVTMDLKEPGNLLYLIGETRNEMGGSHYHLLNGIDGGTSPQPNLNAPEIMRAMHRAFQVGVVVSCHDCSEGGLAVALAEMCIAGRLGAEIAYPAMMSLPRDVNSRQGDDDEREEPNWPAALFSESLSRFIIEVPVDADDALLKIIPSGVGVTYLGRVTDTPRLSFPYNDDDVTTNTFIRREVVGVKVVELESAWCGRLPSAPVLVNDDEAYDPAPLHAGASAERLLAPALLSRPRVLILHARGTNRDRDAALACQLAGGEAEIVTVYQLTHGERSLLDYHMLVVPGGFSFGDDLGAGVLWALALKETLGEDIRRFVDSGRPVLGICNGFQTLVKADLLPGPEFIAEGARAITLTYNESGHFECRWVHLQANPNSPCVFTRGLDDLIYCPVAHGEGRLAVRDPETLARLQAANLIALSYVSADGSAAAYPANPNGSLLDIAGLTNPTGNVLGLMPHPEDHIFPWQHPRWSRGERGKIGLRLFENGIRACGAL